MQLESIKIPVNIPEIYKFCWSDIKYLFSDWKIGFLQRKVSEKLKPQLTYHRRNTAFFEQMRGLVINGQEEAAKNYYHQVKGGVSMT